jgi:hypothetical protein
MSKEKNEAQRKLVGALGGGIAVASDGDSMPGMQDAVGQPTPPPEAIPTHNFALDVESFCKTGGCDLLGQDESDPSFLVFKQGDSKFKLPQSMFRSGFRGSNTAND